ncbi:MAG: hypothetical protein L0I29_19430 [Hyphomicrobiales bacterium]|nr:hypothetical protein [Hyphomicrobiales bacterium]
MSTVAAACQVAAYGCAENIDPAREIEIGGHDDREDRRFVHAAATKRIEA